MSSGGTSPRAAAREGAPLQEGATSLVPERVSDREEEPGASETAAVSTDAGLLATLWERLAPLLPQPRRSGRQIVYDRRTILEAIVYVVRTDCGWKELPSRFPPWKTVHEQFVAWRKAGIWDQIWHDLTVPGPCALE